MEKSEKTEKLRGLIKPAIENRGAFLVDISIRGDNKKRILEVFCETESGISIDKCAEISREILPLIDSSKIFGDNFRLEVSSPGIGSPLKDRRQFKRNIGKLMSVKYQGILHGTLAPTREDYSGAGSSSDFEVKQATGELIDVDDDAITIATETGSVRIGIDSILEVMVNVRW